MEHLYLCWRIPATLGSKVASKLALQTAYFVDETVPELEV
jgi:hypothetical protein